MCFPDVCILHRVFRLGLRRGLLRPSGCHFRFRPQGRAGHVTDNGFVVFTVLVHVFGSSDIPVVFLRLQPRQKAGVLGFVRDGELGLGGLDPANEMFGTSNRRSSQKLDSNTSILEVPVCKLFLLLHEGQFADEHLRAQTPHVDVFLKEPLPATGHSAPHT